MSPSLSGENKELKSSFTGASCQEDYFNTLIRLRLLSPVNPKTDAKNATTSRARSPHDYAPSQGTRPEARQCSREAFHAALHERAELTVRILVLIGFVSLDSKG